MSGERSRELWTNREVVLASDLTRIGKLANKEIQEAEKVRSVRPDFYLPSSNTFDDLGIAVKSPAFAPISGVIMAPSIDPSPATYNVLLGAGEGHVVGTGTIPDDESDYQFLRWEAQTVVWPEAGYPNPTNPRICLVVATPADVADELQSRNILVNIDTRETSPANVYKLSRPQATISVLVGTAAATPVPPACPAGSLALFEVIVPAGVSDSSDYNFVRRAWRRVEFPGTSQHGIVKGCVPSLMSDTFIGIPAGGHRIVIDGELLTWAHTKTLPCSFDSAGNPGTAPGTYDLPCYLYLCGGRWSPSRSQGLDPAPGPGGTWSPVLLVESTTAPDPFGYPTASLVVGGVTFPRAACCYIGLRFRAAGTGNNVPAIHDGDWFWFQNQGISGVLCAKNPQVVTSGDYVQVPLSSLPAASVTTAGQVVGIQNVIPGGGTSYTKFAAGGGGDSAMFASVKTEVGTVTLVSRPVVLSRTMMEDLWATTNAGAGVGINIVATGFNMNVPRLSR